MNANVYQNLLQQHAVPSLQASPNHPAISMQDNAPRHTEKQVKQFLEATLLEIKVKAVTGAVPFQKVMFVPKGSILVP